LIYRLIRNRPIFEFVDRHFRSIGDSLTTAVRLFNLRCDFVIIIAALPQEEHRPEQQDGEQAEEHRLSGTLTDDSGEPP
jgi:hypothetical protein